MFLGKMEGVEVRPLVSTFGHDNLALLATCKLAKPLVLPDALPHVAVRVLGGEGGEQGAGGQTLLQLDGLGVGAELRALVDVQDAHGHGGGGLTGQVDAAGQRHFVLRLHCQHEGAIHLEVDGLQRRGRGRLE